jgi:peptide methionine sulfoxide reductase msrA/msrB
MMKKILAMLMLIALLLTACNAAINVGQTDPTEQNDAEAMEPITATAIDNTYSKQEGVEVIYFAGGCFWGVEKLMQSIPGVVAATSGYANGQSDIVPSYEQGC